MGEGFPGEHVAPTATDLGGQVPGRGPGQLCARWTGLDRLRPPDRAAVAACQDPRSEGAHRRIWGDCREPLGQCRTQRTRGRGDRRGSGGGTRGPAAAVGPGGAAGGPVGLHVVRLHSAWARGSRDQAGHCRDTVTRHGTVALPRTRTPPLCLPSVPRAAVSQAPRPPTRGGPRPLAPPPGPRVCPERGSVSLREAPRIGSVGHRDTCRGHRHSAPLLGTDVLNLRLGDGRHATPPGRTSTTVTMRRCLSDPLTSPPLWWARAPRESHRPPWQRRARLRLAECVWTLHGPRPRPTRSGGLLLLLLSK